MTHITHHPSEALLLDYYHGRLAEGPELLVATHAGMCAHCRDTLRLFPSIGGALLEDVEGLELSADALELALARIERPIEAPGASQPETAQATAHQVRSFLNAYDVPAVIKVRTPARYWAAPGVWVAPVRTREARRTLAERKTKTYLLKVAPGLVMPMHGHGGTEMTLVLAGGFSDADGTYDVGDFIERAPGEAHSPKIDATEGCLSLITHTEPIKPKTILGFLLKPFARI
jgi:putative transcriptional regulator